MRSVLVVLWIVSWHMVVITAAGLSVNITTKTRDEIICKGPSAIFDCGYVFSDFRIFPPQWRINETVHTFSQIVNDTDDLLSWQMDGFDTAGTGISVGPVDGELATPKLTVSDVALTHFTISWTTLEVDTNSICGPVMYNMAISGPLFLNVTSIGSNTITYTGLTLSTGYTIIVTPHNDAGNGPAASKAVTTLTPSAPFPPTDLRLNLKFINGIPNITVSWMLLPLAANMTEIEYYNFDLAVNGTGYAGGHVDVPDGATMVDLFHIYPSSFHMERYTNYTVTISAGNSFGDGQLTEPVSIVTSYIQDASATPGRKKITISCTTAESDPRAMCNAVINCDGDMPVMVHLQNGIPLNYTTIEPCNISIDVFSVSNSSEPLEELSFIHVVPLVFPNESSGDNFSVGAIVRIVAGVIVFIAVIVIIIVAVGVIYNRQRKDVNITMPPGDAVICKGSSAIFYCGYVFSDFRNLPPQWRINGTVYTFSQIENNTDDLLDWEQDGSDTETTGLYVGPVDDRFVGVITFQCELPTTPVLKTNIATLTVIGEPAIPTITVSNVTLTNITISWTIPEVDTNSTETCGPVMYTVIITGPLFLNVTGIRDRRDTFTQLTPNTNYTIIVTPHNNAGNGPSANKVVTTLTPSAPFPPTNLQLNLKFINGRPNITVSWMLLPLAANMTEVEYYAVSLVASDGRELLENVTIIHLPVGTIMVDLFHIFPSSFNLERFTRYTVSISAVNSFGAGEFTEPVSIMTSFIQEASATPGRERITVSCITAESDPRVICKAVVNCDGDMPGPLTLLLQNGIPLNHTTTEPCNISIYVFSVSNINEPLEESSFINVVPLALPNESSGSSFSVGAIVGVVAGVIVFIAVIVIVIVAAAVICRYRKGVTRKGNKTLKTPQPHVYYYADAVRRQPVVIYDVVYDNVRDHTNGDINVQADYYEDYPEDYPANNNANPGSTESDPAYM